MKKRRCQRCDWDAPELTHCHSTNQWLCEPCIITLAHQYYTATFLPSIIPTLPEEDPHQ